MAETTETQTQATPTIEDLSTIDPNRMFEQLRKKEFGKVQAGVRTDVKGVVNPGTNRSPRSVNPLFDRDNRYEAANFYPF